MRAIGAAALLLTACLGVDQSAPGDLAAPNDAAGDAAVDAAMPPPPDLAKPPVPYVYVSGYSPQIARYTLDASGALTAAGTTSITGAPSFLAVNPTHRHLYAVDEAAAGRVEAFAIDQKSGALTHLDDVSSGGNGPAHVSVDWSGTWVFAANYGDGTVAVLPAAADGSLGAATDTRAAGANAHQIIGDANTQFVYVPCKGADYIAEYTFDAQHGKLAPATPARVATPAGSGPRHLAFHPAGAYAYAIQENDSTMTAYTISAGQLAAMQTLSTRAAGATGANTGAEVAVHPTGKFLYGSNRGDDNIVRYTLDASGRMTLAGHTPSGGQTPRHFSIDPSGNFLLVANQTSNNVVVFAIDPQSGALSTTGAPITAPSPTFVGVVTLPGP